MKTSWSQILYLDGRSVSIFRIILGVSVLYNLFLIKWPYATEIWGSTPLIPADVMKYMNGADSLGIFDFIRYDWFAYCWLTVSILLAVLYTVGYRSRITGAILVFFLFNLLQAYQRYLGGYEKYTILMLFWSCFLPLDNYFSVRKAGGNTYPEKRIIFIILLQIAIIYFTTGLAKFGGAWQGGYAVKMICSDVIRSRWIAGWIADKSWVYTPLTYLTLFFEYVFPLLLFTPYRNIIFRSIAVLFLLGFHAGIFLTADVGNFSITGVAAAVLLVPGKFWDRYTDIHLLASVPSAKNGWQKKGYLMLTAVAVYLIVIKSSVFVVKYTVVSKWKPAAAVAIWIDRLNPKTILDETIFFQEWKMYAPEPINELGWLSIEYIGEDGLYYDFFTNNIIDQQRPERYYFPGGMEKQLLTYARALHFGNKPYVRVFLKYWYLDKLRQRGIEQGAYDKYFLAIYSYDFNKYIYLTPMIEKKYYQTKALQEINTTLPKNISSSESAF